MGVGHAALAAGAAKAFPRMNVGWLIVAAFLADLLLGIFAAMGLEHAIVPPDYATKHYLLFSFPYSHGLLPLILFGGLLGFLVSRFHQSSQNKVWLLVAPWWCRISFWMDSFMLPVFRSPEKILQNLGSGCGPTCARS